jgi:hypothetical protein
MIIYHSDCDGNETFIRASGKCVCECGKFYWQHPYCSNSKFIDDLGRDDYYLHILCDGTHVKL